MRCFCKMKKAIYKIENLINHKMYIGQSNRPEERFAEHLRCTVKGKSLIRDAILKYGRENFRMEIIGWFEDYNEKEKYYIQYYNCLAPNGYNILSGGEEPPHGSGENNNFAKISNETAQHIKEDLKNYDIPRREIKKKYNVTDDIIRHINDGSSWHDENESYPLRPGETELNNIRAEKIIRDLILTDIPQNQLGPKYGWGRSAAKMINWGKNHYNPNLIYPIRQHKEENKAILNL